MSGTLADLLDYVGNRVIDGITGVKAVYSAAASDDPLLVRPIPASFDAAITCLIWPQAGDLQAGNTESFPVQIDLHFWVLKENAGTALRVSIPIVDACRALFRTDVTAGGNCEWFLMRGFDPPIEQEYNGVTYLVTTVRCNGLLLHFSHDYTV